VVHLEPLEGIRHKNPVGVLQEWEPTRGRKRTTPYNRDTFRGSRNIFFTAVSL